MAAAVALGTATGRRRRRVLPGFGLTLGFTLSYLALVVLVPLSVLFAQAAGAGWAKWWAELSIPAPCRPFA